MKNLPTLLKSTLAVSACVIFAAASATAQLAPNQTHGFGANQVVTFSYTQNFDCVDQPTMDLDFNKKLAQSDPNEMQRPICQAVTEPTADPTGGPIANTAHLYVLVPMFSVNNDRNPNDAMACPPNGPAGAEREHSRKKGNQGDEDNQVEEENQESGGRPGELCGRALGQELIKLFGFVPEAWKTKVNPAITTQCPDPNNPVPGTCTMHASSVDLSVTLAALGLTGPPTKPLFVPTPNHSHVVDDSEVTTGDIWWEVRPVLVMDQRDWPAADGSSGITSSEIMDQVEGAGRAIEVGSNFFLFFNSKLTSMGRINH